MMTTGKVMGVLRLLDIFLLRTIMWHGVWRNLHFLGSRVRTRCIYHTMFASLPYR